MKLKKTYKIITLVMCIAVIGFIFSGCGAISVGNGEYEEKKYTTEKTVDKIVVDNYRTDTIFSVSPDDKFHITCYENKKFKFEITESDNGVLNIDQAEIKQISIFELPSENQKVLIEVPATFQGDIEGSFGRVKLLIDGIKTNNIKIESSRGEIKFNQVQATGNIDINGYRASISLLDTKSENEILVISERGDIDFENLEVGMQLHIENYRGDISGNVKGLISDYSITSKIRRGESNLPSRMLNDRKTMYIENSRGDINVNFD